MTEVKASKEVSMVVVEDTQRLIVKRVVKLKDYTSIKIGGRVSRFFIVNTEQDLSKLVKETGGLFYLLGKGSNILASDERLSKPVIKLGEEFDYIKRDFSLVEVGAATSFLKLVKYAVENELEGVENLVGIPASVGGMVCMNASSFGREISSVVERVRCMDKEGSISIVEKDEMKFAYRKSSFANRIILSVWFKFENGFNLKEKAKNFLKERRIRGDYDYPSCGCVFKNLPGGVFSGALIEGCGLKGVRKNNAAVSERHANFIVNLGGAGFKDVECLIKMIKEKVHEKYNVVLEEEIHRWT
ncbi:MAG: UDP-N-acetylmuramate dehydrogenase [Candidatus Omnitrophica bacterium]|nr:UDP-N-acetylmuramate dehydrogenase [Candidatus Omnitrophota bacterium]